MHAAPVILVVEDDPLVRRLSCRIIGEMGFACEEAGDGATALDMLRSRASRYSLILTDIAMPGINGADLCSTVLHEDPEQQILCMSAYPASTLASTGRLPGWVPFIPKPFRPDQLERTIRGLLRGRADGERPA